ncbi:MAG: carboxypeptidase regulatory-like domain-containing protein [Chloroflexi bacterium]|nr:carboxypeptidase regulatory-like domain-containing protein [Chloroflexota bacterium]
MYRRFLSILAVLAVVLVATLGGSNHAAAAGESGLARAIAAQEANTDTLLAIDGVIGTAVGQAESGGHVVLALTTAAGVRGIPWSVDGVVVRPYVTGEISAQPKPGSGVDPTGRFARPVPIGVSTGHPDITAGTIGARVVDGSGNIYALSNNHVYAAQNAANIGDAVIQPGAYDGGTISTDVIGNLTDFEPIVFTTSANNVIDAAIVISDAGRLDNSTPSDGYGTPSGTTVDATVGLPLRKYGRTTGQTDGKVDAINATVNVGYDAGTARFVGQIIIKGQKGSFSAGGDSGSLIVTKDGNNPVALLFAGSTTVTIGNPIGAVLSRFNVAIDDGSGPPPPPPTTGSVAGTVTSLDTGLPISGANVSAGGQSAITAGDGTYTIASVPTGSVTVSVSASGFVSASQSVTVSENQTSTAVNFSLATAQTGTASVQSISYSTSGGGSGTKDLRVTLVVVDGGGVGIEGASIDIDLSRDGSVVAGGSGLTGASGSITFRLRNAASGLYTTEVTGLTADGFIWDGITPANSFVK